MPPPEPKPSAFARDLATSHFAIAGQAVARVGPPLASERAYTDDRAPVEWLVDKSIVDYAAEDD